MFDTINSILSLYISLEINIQKSNSLTDTTFEDTTTPTLDTEESNTYRESTPTEVSTVTTTTGTSKATGESKVFAETTTARSKDHKNPTKPPETVVTNDRRDLIITFLVIFLAILMLC